MPAPRFIVGSSPVAFLVPRAVGRLLRARGRRRGLRVEEEREAPGTSVRRDCGRVTARILLATGGSPQADLASLAAVERAEATGSELHVVYVGRLPNFQMQDPDVVGHDCRLYDEIEQEAREGLRKLTWRVGVAGGTVAASHLRIGWPGREISRLGEEIGADMIVVGSRGRLRRALTGSVSEAVVRHAPCSVLVVRPSRGSPAPRAGRRVRSSSTATR